jgi:heme/copper-type cytochrome/quinol oxidase subunit 2
VNSPGTDEKQAAGWLPLVQTGATLAAGVVGLTAYVYLLGGTIFWLRIYAARLPADNATVAFQDRALLAMGIKALLFELLLLGLAGGVVWGIWKGARHLDHQEERDQRELVSYVILVLLRSLISGLTLISLLIGPFVDLYTGEGAGWVVLTFVLVGLAIAAVDLSGRMPKTVWSLGAKAMKNDWFQLLRFLLALLVIFIAVTYMAVALGITVLVLLVLLVLFHRYRRSPHPPGPRTTRELLLPALILAMALNLVIIPYLATPPVTFDHAWVTTKDGDHFDGAYLGRTSEGVFLATCLQRPNPTRSYEGRIEVVPAEDVEHVVVGGFKYSFDVGNRPSLIALAKHFAMGVDLHGDDNGFLLDVRSAPHVCGIKGTE